MPTFSFTKTHDYRDGVGDPTVTMTFTTDSIETLRENFEDFLNGAGFVSKPEEDNIVNFERRVTKDDYVAKEEDFMWNDAFKSKFGKNTFDNFTLGDK